MPNRPHIDLGPLLSYLSGNQSLQSNPAYGATEPGQVDYSYTGDPSEAITKFGSSSPFIKPSALQAYGNPQLMTDYNKFQYAPVKAEQERQFQDLATRSGTDTHKALWLENVYKPQQFAFKNPDGTQMPPDVAYAQFNASPQVNWNNLNPNLQAGVFAGQGGPENVGLNNALLARRDYQQNTLADMLGTPGTETLGRDAAARYGLDKTQANSSLLNLETDLSKRTLGNNINYQTETVPAQQALDLNRIRATIGNLPLENQATTLGLQNRIFEGTHGTDMAHLPSLRELPTLSGGQVSYGSNPLFTSPMMQQIEDSRAAMSSLSGGSPLELAAQSAGLKKVTPSIPIDGAPRSTSVHLPGAATGTNQIAAPMGSSASVTASQTSNPAFANVDYNSLTPKFVQDKVAKIQELQQQIAEWKKKYPQYANYMAAPGQIELEDLQRSIR